VGEYAAGYKLAQRIPLPGETPQTRRRAMGRRRIQRQRATIGQYAKRAGVAGLRGLAYVVQPAISAAEVAEQAGRGLVAAVTERPAERPGDVAMYAKRAARALANIPLSIPLLRELPGIKQLERMTALKPEEMTIGGEAAEDFFDALGVGEGPRFGIPFTDWDVSARRIASFGLGFLYNPMTYMSTFGKTAKGIEAAKRFAPGVKGLAPTLAAQSLKRQRALLTWGLTRATRRPLIQGQAVFNIISKLGDKFRHTAWGSWLLGNLSTMPIPPERFEQGWIARMASERLGHEIAEKIRPFEDDIARLALGVEDNSRAYRLAEMIRVTAEGGIEAVPDYAKAVAKAPEKILQAAGGYRRALDVYYPAMKAAGYDLPEHLAGAWSIVEDYTKQATIARAAGKTKLAGTLEEAAVAQARKIHQKGISYVPRRAQPRVAKLLQLENMPPADYIQETTRDIAKMARNRGQGKRLAQWWQRVAGGDRVYAERTRAFLHRTWLDNDLLPMTMDQVDDVVQRASTKHLELVKKAIEPGFLERAAEKYLGYTANRSFYMDSPQGVMAVYHQGIKRAVRGQAFMKAMRKVASKTFEEGMIPGDAFSKTLKGVWLKADDALEVSRAVKRLVVPEFASNTWRLMRYLTRKWVPFVTGVRPAFHVRNWYSNKWLNALGGVYDPGVYKRAYGAYWKNLYNLPMGADDVRVLKEVNNMGVLGQFAGQIGEFQKRVPSRYRGRVMQALQLANPLSDRWFAAHWGREFGSHIENMDRLAHYMGKRSQGYSAWAAAFSVKKHLFDYGELTSWERKYMKAVVPFWSWLKNNVRLQTEMFLDKPMMQTFIIRATAPGTAAVPADEAAAIPVYQREGIALRLGRHGDVATYLRGIGLPFEDIGRILTFERKGLWNLEKLLGNMNPIIQQTYEHITGRNAYFGDRLPRNVHGAFQWLQYAPGPVRKALGFRIIQLGGGRRMYQMNPHALSLMRTIGAVSEASRAFDERYTVPQRVARLLTGFRLAHLNVPRELHRNWTRDMKEQLDEMERRGEIRVGEYAYGARTPEAKALLKEQRLMGR